MKRRVESTRYRSHASGDRLSRDLNEVRPRGNGSEPSRRRERQVQKPAMESDLAQLVVSERSPADVWRTDWKVHEWKGSRVWLEG